MVIKKAGSVAGTSFYNDSCTHNIYSIRSFVSGYLAMHLYGIKIENRTWVGAVPASVISAAPSIVAATAAAATPASNAFAQQQASVRISDQSE